MGRYLSLGLCQPHWVTTVREPDLGPGPREGWSKHRLVTLRDCSRNGRCRSQRGKIILPYPPSPEISEEARVLSHGVAAEDPSVPVGCQHSCPTVNGPPRSCTFTVRGKVHDVCVVVYSVTSGQESLSPVQLVYEVPFDPRTRSHLSTTWSILSPFSDEI